MLQTTRKTTLTAAVSTYVDDTVDGLTLGHGGIDIGDKTADREQLAGAETQLENLNNNLMVSKAQTTSRENISFAR